MKNNGMAIKSIKILIYKKWNQNNGIYAKVWELLLI